jgi:hypothetical protein
VLAVGCAPSVAAEHEFVAVVKGLSNYFSGASNVIGAALKYKRPNLIALSESSFN